MSARIVFDLDGTLIDSLPDIHAATRRLLEEEGIAPLDMATIRSFVGNGLPHLTGLVMQATGLGDRDHAEMSARVLAHYNAVSGSLTRPYDGVIEALEQLRHAGHRLGICTNKPEAPARHIIEDMGLGPFDVILGGDSLDARKPDPRPLLKSFEVMGQGPVLFVGDSEVDAETAKRADVPFLLFTEGYRKSPPEALPHLVMFSDFDSLPELVASSLQST